MSILGIIVAIVVVGILLWVINKYVPMDAGIKKLLNIVVILVLIVWLLKAFGIISWLSTITV